MKMFKTKGEVKRLPEPELKRIALNDIRFAPYQREIKREKVNKIVKNFMPDIVGIGLVSFRNGLIWGLDAQHRIEALKEQGYTEILCQVLVGLTYEEECRRFNILNTGRTQLTSNQVFHCRVEEKEPVAMALIELFKKYRFGYNKDASTKQDNIIGAVSKFDKMYKTYGSDMVERVLEVLRSAWFGDKNSLSSAIITGLSTFLAENENIDTLVLIKALEKISPNVLIAQANSYVKCEILRPGRADSACYHIAKMIGQCYEDELKKPKKNKTKR